jgi:phage terminase large subunit-like protein
MSSRTTPRPRQSASRLSESKGQAVVDWIEATCVHTIGKWAGLPFKLVPWQVDFVKAVFGNVDRTGRRRTRIAYLQIARKQGKSELCAAIALYMLIADGEAQPQVYGAAFDREQAAIVYKVAADMVDRSPNLNAYAKPYRGTKRIVCTKGPSKGGFYHCIPADAAGAHGFNASAIIVDELHTQRTSDLIDVLETSMSAREQPLMLAISTAGHDRNSICYRWYSKAKQVQSGVIRDKSFIGRIYELPEGTDFETVAETDAKGRFVRERDLWPLANPSLVGQPRGFIRPDEIRRQVADAMNFPAAQNKVMNLHFNVWTQGESRWFSRSAWDACGGIIIEDRLKGRKCWGGLDLAATSDFNALVYVFPWDDDGGYDVLCRFWLPEAVLDIRSNMRDQLEAWRTFIDFTPGDVTDYEAIKARILRDAEAFNVRSIAYDRFLAMPLVVPLSAEGIDMVPIGQGTRSMNAPAKLLETLVANETVNHGGNPVLRWMADNTVIERDYEDRIKPSKKKSSEKIDGVVALCMALSEAIREQEDAPEVAFYSFA